MGMISVNCPNCGATMDFDESREFCFCQYCGTKVTHEKIIVEHKGTVSVNGIATLNNILERANIFLKDGDFDGAVSYFNKALDVSPKCSLAYWGLVLCKYHVKSDEELKQIASNHVISIENLTEYKNALSFASDTERDKIITTRKELTRCQNAVLSRIQQLKRDKTLASETIEKFKLYKICGAGVLVFFFIFMFWLSDMLDLKALYYSSMIIDAVCAVVMAKIINKKVNENNLIMDKANKEISILSFNPLNSSNEKTHNKSASENKANQNAFVLSVPVNGFERGEFILTVNSLTYKAGRKVVSYRLSDLQRVESKAYWFLVYKKGSKNPIMYPMGGKLNDVKLLVSETNKYIPK